MATCGTRSAYVAGCHCGPCRRAHTAAQTLWRHSGSAARSPGPGIRVLGDRRWFDRAACAGHGFDAWFVDDPGGKYVAARAVCDRCVVKPDCLAWAIEAKIIHGMWGGLNPAERARVARRVRRQAGHTRVDTQIFWLVFLVVFIAVGFRLLGLSL